MIVEPVSMENSMGHEDHESLNLEIVVPFLDYSCFVVVVALDNLEEIFGLILEKIVAAVAMDDHQKMVICLVKNFAYSNEDNDASVAVLVDVDDDAVDFVADDDDDDAIESISDSLLFLSLIDLTVATSVTYEFDGDDTIASSDGVGDNFDFNVENCDPLLLLLFGEIAPPPPPIPLAPVFGAERFERRISDELIQFIVLLFNNLFIIGVDVAKLLVLSSFLNHYEVYIIGVLAAIKLANADSSFIIGGGGGGGKSDCDAMIYCNQFLLAKY
ncbi:hypothetical protein DERP_009365 [Dermatophagoides pteronyssinus]|uniref:Uncharacterized protein n=1 Tax=Dermatophagoides pteronyssinus TaxID=6956 RepID=A0ABQ8ITM5_DERPT|nr:hypothetical protein DERP_009365 [Dermatophagoides pteronyssinus]